MLQDNLVDLVAFKTVAQLGSFTKAAAQLSLSQSRLSQTIRQLEERLGVRLLNRTTRSVALTPEGEHLLATVGPGLEQIEAGLVELGEFHSRPAARFRITADENAARNILWPKLRPFLREQPHIDIEIVCDYSLTDIVAEHFDAGVRYGDQVEKDMIAVPIGPLARMAVVGSPDYFAAHDAPMRPQDLTAYECINLRYVKSGRIYVWEFEQDKTPMNVKVQGRLTFNSIFPIHEAALSGMGLAYLPREQVEADIAAGRLRAVLEDWCPPMPGYYLYFSSRRQTSPAFSLLVEALKHRR